MKFINRSAVSALATALAHPFRGSSAPVAAPANPLKAPSLAIPRAVAGTVRGEVSTDVKALFDQLNGAFNEFKSTNDERLKAKTDDAVVTAKLDAINATLDQLEKSIDDQARTTAAASLHGDGRKIADPEYSKLFDGWMRNAAGIDEDKIKAAQKTGVRAAMSEGVPADGGYTTPIEWDRTIGERLKLISPIRQNSTVQTISKAGFTKLFTDRAVGSGWVGETAARPATATPQFTSLGFGLGQLYANAAASQDLLDDSEIDIEQWLLGEIETEFARQEGIAHLSGDGTNKPFGILTYVTGAAQAARHPWGDIKVQNSGAAAALTSDGLVSTVYALPAAYTPNAKWFMNRTSLGAVRKLKDGQGNYLWQPTYVAGQPSTLMGYSLIDTPDMPNVAAGNIAALFGDMRETYLIVDRISFRVLRDPYTNKPFICFYCTKRTGGGVKNPDAMKAVLVSA